MWCTTWPATYSALDAADKLLQLFIHLGNFAFCINIHRRQSLNFIDAKKPGSGAGNYRQTRQCNIVAQEGSDSLFITLSDSVARFKTSDASR